MKLPNGFQAAGISAGLKRSGRPDLALIYAPGPVTWAFTGTTNVVQAPCVTRNRALYQDLAGVRAVIVNSGNANCANGPAGARDNDTFAAETAAQLGLAAGQVLTASTGIIGRPMPMEPLMAGLPATKAALSDEADAFARAILTTDLVPKLAETHVTGGARVVGATKGSGMIHPNMATMLAFVMTDAAVDQATLSALWPRVVDASFNQLTVDGDTSTNDMAIVLASGLVPSDPQELEKALLEVCASLAKQIARDGEGATRLMTVRVTGAASAAEARAAAKTVAGSSLVKTAVHGADPNWGRILAAAGRSGAASDPTRARVAAQGFTLYQGEPLPFDEAAVSQALRAEEVLLEVDLAAGDYGAEAWGCDLSAEYVRINADYTT
ncbi:MAG: bifunctional glutamate N-acetyltransferase/amino-acid acetyltransferase ArgJ [Trueperaceae bacterium]